MVFCREPEAGTIDHHCWIGYQQRLGGLSPRKFSKQTTSHLLFWQPSSLRLTVLPTHPSHVSVGLASRLGCVSSSSRRVTLSYTAWLTFRRATPAAVGIEALRLVVPGWMSASASGPAPDAASEIVVNVADEIEVAGDRTPDPDLDLGLDLDHDGSGEHDLDQEQNGEKEQEQEQGQEMEQELDHEMEHETEHEQDHQNEAEPDLKHEPEPDPESQPGLDLDSVSEAPEPADSGKAQHEQPVQSHQSQAQTNHDHEDSHAEGVSQAEVNGDAPHARAASASASAQHQDSEDHKGHGHGKSICSLESFL